MKKSLLFSLILATPLATRADIRLPAIFSDHMVLERSAKVPVWGAADPGEQVTIILDGQIKKTTADDRGHWKAILNLADSASGPFEMTVAGKNKIQISDVVVGEVWIASGQSNMEWLLMNTRDATREIAQSANPMLRQFRVAKETSPEPLADGKGQWGAASPATSAAFSAVGYYFGKALQNELKVPVGIVNVSWGSTPSEPWTDAASLANSPELQPGAAKADSYEREFPDIKSKWAGEFAAWLKQNAREDKPTVNVAAFAAPDASTDGWITIAIPGPLKGEGLPIAGAIWLRRTVEIPAEKAGTSVAIAIGYAPGFESVFWNGELVKQLTPAEHPGFGAPRSYSVPANLVKPGSNTLAIRVYEPGAFSVFPAPSVAGGTMGGKWLAKADFDLPAATSKAPSIPKSPMSLHSISSRIFNGMVNPLIPYAISGVIWYQGESNVIRAWQYRTAFPLLITGWRARWGQGDFPFYFCQLANFTEKSSIPGENSAWAELREAQSCALSLPNTGQAVLIDLGESQDIHPRNKKTVGERLSRIALARDYGKDIPFSGPLYASSEKDGGKIRVSFAHADGGLAAHPISATYDVSSVNGQTAPTNRNSPDSELEGFAICGQDKQWVWANAKIDGDTVLVWSDKVPQPVAVRYAWSNNPTCNLYSRVGLPASPFRTDDFPASTKDTKY